MRVEELVGLRIRAARDERGMTQEQLGQAIGELLGKPWPRQTVSSAEAGRRAFTAAELVVIAHALGRNVGWLLMPPAISEGVDLPGGARLSRDELAASALSLSAPEYQFAEIQKTIGQMANHIGEANSDLTAAIRSMNVLLDQFGTYVTVSNGIPDVLTQEEGVQGDPEGN